MNLEVGSSVILHGFDCPPATIIPDGKYTISKVNDDGTFHVGGNTAVQPSRVKAILKVSGK